jgi:tetratricopeptide (TPR) repeat protein
MPPPEDLTYESAKQELLAAGLPTRVALRALINDDEDTIAYNALELELTLLGRDRDFSEYRSLVTASRARFQKIPRFLSLEAQACRWSTDEHTLRTGLEYAKKAREALPNSPAVLNTFAAIVVLLAEQGKATEQWLAEAEEALRHASYLNPTYSKYHHILAQILLHQKRYEEAQQAVSQAIELEPSTSPHYALRIGDYQDTRMAILFNQRSDQLQREHKEVIGTITRMRTEFEAMRSEFILLLGLLAAIVAFVVTGVEVAKAQTLSNAAGLMIIIGAMISGVFASFRLIFLDHTQNREGTRRAYIVLSFSVLVVLVVWGLAR